MSDEEPPQEAFVPQAPAIKKSAYTQAWDQTANAMVAASEQRANEAADQLRDSYDAARKLDPHQGDTRLLDHLERHEIDELKSGLKITNMREPNEMREGDSAVITNSAAANNLSIGGSRPGFQSMGGGLQNFAPGVGPSRSGSLTHGKMNGHPGWIDGTPASPNPVHQERAAAMTRAGQLGIYTGK